MPPMYNCRMHDSYDESVDCPLQLLVMNTNVDVAADPPMMTLEHGTHEHVDVVVPKVLEVVDPPIHVPVHGTHVVGTMKAAP